MKLIDKIKERLSTPLPGQDSQYQMAPMGRKEDAKQVESYTAAAVLALIYPKDDEHHMVFIQRTSHEKDKHSAQIAFPGGKIEENDESIISGALREAEEEIGVNPAHVEILGELTPLKIPISGFEVFPVLGYSKNALNFIRQETEVQRIIEVSIVDLLDPKFRIKKTLKLSTGMILKDVPAFNFDEDIIWGATSMMLNEIIDILK